MPHPDHLHTSEETHTYGINPAPDEIRTATPVSGRHDRIRKLVDLFLRTKREQPAAPKTAGDDRIRGPRE